MKQTKSGRFNIIDVLIILLVLAIIGVGVYILFFRNSSQEKVKIDYLIETPFIRSEFKDRIKVGDTVVNTSTKDILGTVVNVEYTPALLVTTNRKDGTQHLAPYPDDAFVTAKVTIRSDAAFSDNMYFVNSAKLYIGSQMIYFRVPDYTGSATCIDITVLEAYRLRDGKDA